MKRLEEELTMEDSGGKTGGGDDFEGTDGWQVKAGKNKARGFFSFVADLGFEISCFASSGVGFSIKSSNTGVSRRGCQVGCTTDGGGVREALLAPVADGVREALLAPVVDPADCAKLCSRPRVDPALPDAVRSLFRC